MSRKTLPAYLSSFDLHPAIWLTAVTPHRPGTILLTISPDRLKMKGRTILSPAYASHGRKVSHSRKIINCRKYSVGLGQGPYGQWGYSTPSSATNFDVSSLTTKEVLQPRHIDTVIECSVAKAERGIQRVLLCRTAAFYSHKADEVAICNLTLKKNTAMQEHYISPSHLHVAGVK